MSTTSIFAVIGYYRDRTEELLLQGGDGRWYAWPSPASEPFPVSDDELEMDWRIDGRADERDELPDAPNA